jgi:3-oxoacyl-(acyl-carrier-protein) synthase
LCRLTLVGFSSLKLLDPERPRPFDAGRQGTSLGEAAAALILAPGHDLRGSVRGWGAIAEAHHPVQPRADGDGARRAMAAALADAGLDPAAVDCVNAHATATPANDLAEARGIESLLPPVPVSGSKSQLGHSLGAAGAVEAVVALLALEGGFVPPTVGLRQLDGDIGVDVVTQARPFSGGLALSNSFAFGGNDVSLCLAARGWS